ncbi:MAG: family 43 glycosylhydrolase [Deltaproteobacteria bacterium]|nr:family 43 glycosylhydrolase [Deltaproteobacteria bacterium]
MDADTDTDSDTDTDTDTDTDSDTDTDTDTDIDADTDTDTDTDTGTEIDTDSTPVYGVNPIIQTKFTADPAPLVYEDTLYLYTTHDEDDATGFRMYDWMLYSTKDMVNWTDHGVVAGVRDPNRTFDWSSGENAWAPQAIFRNGKFYLYCPMNRSDSWHSDIGVAVADSPIGPFVDAIGGPLIHNPDSSDDIDPSVFIDDDGQAYLYWGHKRIFYVKLNEDMISYSGDIIEFERPDLFEEGPWFYKRADKYYLAFASYCCPEGIGYAMSDGPTGPWTTMGYIMQPVSRSSGNHPGIVEFKGTTYLFGFHYELNFAETSEHRERRSICVDEMPYNADGTIDERPWWSEIGQLQLSRLNPYQQIEAETIAWASGLKTEACAEGGMNVTDIDNGDFIEVRGVSFGSGAGKFEARVASENGGTIALHLDNRDGAPVGTCTVPNTGGGQKWETVSCDVSGAKGLHNLYFVFTGGAGKLFNFNWWKFTRN